MIFISCSFAGFRVIGETSISQNYGIISRNFYNVISRNFEIITRNKRNFDFAKLRRNFDKSNLVISETSIQTSLQENTLTFLDMNFTI